MTPVGGSVIGKLKYHEKLYVMKFLSWIDFNQIFRNPKSRDTNLKIFHTHQSPVIYGEFTLILEKNSDFLDKDFMIFKYSQLPS